VTVEPVPRPRASRARTPAEIAALAQAACVLEVAADKPGNVSRRHDFGDTRFEDFLLSAIAVGAALGAAGTASVGQTVLAAVRDTRRWVPVNTNLGIVLLLAPLARAAAGEGGPLRERLATVLAGLTLEDARAAYAAIRLAAPGGLGEAEAQDVGQEPTVTLREAMALAADRDTIAREYVTDYDVTFALAVPALRRARADGLGWPAATLESYLRVLAEVPDTLIGRKRGGEVARAVSARARAVLESGGPGSAPRTRSLDAFDAELRAESGLNPGATADLMAAALFVALGEEP
jgi:triphosphoribosyl-dephospho-CoA synthase